VTTGEETAEHPVAELGGAERRDQRSLWHPLVVLPELAWMLVLVFGYSLARLLVVDRGAAVHDARWLWALERTMHLPSEATLQRLVLDWPSLVDAANDYYASAHFPVTAVFLFWVYVWRHDWWRWVRNAMTAFTAAALLMEALFPMAPPRLVPDFGLVDTGRVLGESVYPASTHNGLANQFAAMPSVHVGWALLVGLGVVVIARGPWRWLALAHPVLTVAVVTVTANHYWADSLVAAILVAAALLAPRPVRRRFPGGGGRSLPELSG
jgi:hypothetical protein